VSEQGDKPELDVGTVVYATDFSHCSENAGNYARLLALQLRTKLFVVHAFILSQAALEVEFEGKQRRSKQRIDLQAILSQKAVALSSSSLEVVPVLLEGDPHHAIPEFAEKHGPSLIVLGTHGGGRVARGLIGSVAEKILRSTLWPSLTVGPQATSVSPTTVALPFKRILCATDFTPAAVRAIAFALALADTCEGEIDVLNVVPERAIEHPDRLAELRSHFYAALDQSLPKRAREYSQPQTFVEVGNAHDRILEHVTNRSIDLLVLGIRKTSHLGLEMRASGAFRIIVDASCPVLTITG
jgi:nucleotide-binding universal stress UspA family protein